MPGKDGFKTSMIGNKKKKKKNIHPNSTRYDFIRNRVCVCVYIYIYIYIYIRMYIYNIYIYYNYLIKIITETYITFTI